MRPPQQERPTLRPFQAAFVEHIRNAMPDGGTHWLIAPAGLGKSVTAAAAIREAVQSQSVSRVLVLCPRALVEQWTYMLRAEGVDVLRLLPADWRLLRESAGPESVLPSGTYVLSIDFAKKDDVADHLCRTFWDLVVIDEAHGLSGQRERLAERLKSRSVTRLLISGTPPLALESKSTPTSVTDWRPVMEEFLSEVPGLVLERRSVEYSRTPEEIAFFEKVVDASRRMPPSRGCVLLQLAQSSPSALEAALLRWSGGPDLQPVESEVLDALLEALEDLHTDSHLECALGVVRDLTAAGIRHVVVFCNYVDTATYVATATRDLGVMAFVIHGGLSSEERHRAMVEFRDRGGALVATVAEGMSLAFVDAVIHFDAPLTAAVQAQREGRFWRLGRSQSCTTYALRDVSGVLPLGVGADEASEVVEGTHVDGSAEDRTEFIP